MEKKQVNIIKDVVNQDLCVGCGACLYRRMSKDLKMTWNKDGFLVPATTDNCAVLEVEVCPFNPSPADEVRTENELAKLFLHDAPQVHPKLGRYFNTYVGYSKQFRLTSSSGGMATYILQQLFDQNIIDAAIAVGEGSNEFYEYKLVRCKADLLSTSKTKYYPVTLATVLDELRSIEGRVAVVGIGCFMKAVRLLQYYHPELHQKIVFTVGIICGGLKSRFFAEFLAAKAGVETAIFTEPQFRIKDLNSTAGDYSFGCRDAQGEYKEVKMRSVGDMWGTGFFKSNACDFCDDVTTELADISLGDAWISPYVSDGRGTNVLVTRSTLAEKLIGEGIATSALKIEPLDVTQFLSAQQGSFNHRHKGLMYRIRCARRSKMVIPPKRHDNERLQPDFQWVQKQRGKVRKLSLRHWADRRSVAEFDQKMIRPLLKLRRLTTLYHKLGAFKSQIVLWLRRG